MARELLSNWPASSGNASSVSAMPSGSALSGIAMPSGSALSGIAMPSESASSGITISSGSAGTGAMPLYHHGIYVGEGDVIQYTDSSKVQRVSLIEFRAGKQLFRVTYKRGPTPLEPEEVVKKAENEYAEPDAFGVYNIYSNNCEHFATHCKYGERRSQQVIDVTKVVAERVIEKAATSFRAWLVEEKK